jgi:hypothetical protein
MLVQMLFFNGESNIVFQFFENKYKCFNCLLNNTIKTEVIKEEFSYLLNNDIPLDDMVQSIKNEMIETNENLNDLSYFNSRNKLKFIDTFARKCEIMLSKEFKKALLKNIIETYFNGIKIDEIKKLEINVEKYWFLTVNSDYES